MTVEYWTFWPPARLDIVKPHLPAFAERTRYATATLSQVGDFRPKLRTAIVAGTPPDASIGDVFSAALYNDQQVLLQLDTRLKRDRIDLRRDYVLNGFEHWCDRAYAFPLDGFSMALVYNKSLFRERGVPDPWDVQRGSGPGTTSSARRRGSPATTWWASTPTATSWPVATTPSSPPTAGSTSTTAP